MQLQKKRPLFPADGGLSSWVEFATEAELMVSDHWEQLQFFITTLSDENPVILGLPWLQKHNPAIDWATLCLTFRERCDDCRQPVAKERRFQATVEEVEDKEEPPDNISYLTIAQKAGRTCRRKKLRQQQ